MATTFTTTIMSLRAADQEDLEDVVTDVDLVVHVEDGDVKFSTSRTVPMAEVDPTDFTPFADLTEEQVLGWVESHPSTAGFNARLNEVVQREKQRKPLPWQPPADA